jgi:hypothetical protein
MMTTSVNSISAGMDPRQMTQPMQLKANEKTADEELKAEEQQQADTISTQKTNVLPSSTDLRMRQIKQAAEAGILRPVWLEMQEMDQGMPRTSEIIRRAGEKRSEADERTDKPERAPDGDERTVKAERAPNSDERTIKAERAPDSDERTVKSERAIESGRAANEAKPAGKPERAADKQSAS